MQKKIGIFIGVFFVLSIILYSYNIKKFDETVINQKKVFVQRAASFFVSDDEFYFIVDSKAADIKIFDSSGTFIKTFGQKGPGPDEFFMPTFCCYKKPNFVLMDSKKKRLFIYEHKGQTDLKFKQQVLCTMGGYDVLLYMNSLLISSYRPYKQEEYDLYLYNLENNKITYILPSYVKYDCKSYKDLKNNYGKIAKIGLRGFVDCIGDDAYFVWEGNLKIFKINLNSKKISHFGKKTANYIQPIVSNRLLKGFNEGNPKIIKEEKLKMSTIQGIFCDKGIIGLIYFTPDKKLSQLRTILQIYKNEQLKNEFQLADLGANMYFDKKKSTLYLLIIKDSKNLEEESIIIKKYKIIE